MKRYVMLLALLLLLCTVFAIPAQESETVEDGYTLKSDGYWYKDGTPHTRVRNEWQELERRGYGYAYQKYYNYKYTPVKVVYKDKDKEEEYPSYKDPEWRKKLLDIAEKRDKYEAQLRRAQSEHSMYLEAVKSLGLEGNFYWKNYGQIPGSYMNIQSSAVQLGNYGATGNTVYGYNFSQLLDAYGVTDPNLLYQQASALAKNAQDLGGQATDKFQGLVEQAGTHKARVAEAMARAAESQAKGYAAKLALEAANVPASVHIETKGSGTLVTPTPLPKPPQAPDNLTARQKLAVSSCLSCHSGSSLKGGYDVTKHWSLDAPSQVKVVERLMADPTDPRFMPKGGKKLAPDLIMEFLPVKMEKK